MQRKIARISMLLAVLLMVGCGQSLMSRVSLDGARLPPERVTFYALGDWGTGDENQRSVADALGRCIRQLEEDDELNKSPFVVGLGDNVYSYGLPDKPWSDPLVDHLLEVTFGCMYGDITYQGKSLTYHVVPGNHDYGKALHGKDGWGNITHWETTAETLYNGAETPYSSQPMPRLKYYPINHPNPGIEANPEKEFDYLDRILHPQGMGLSCKQSKLLSPQKMETPRQDLVTFVALDTQFLLELYKDKRRNRALIAEQWEQLESILDSATGWKIIVGHHPVETHGRHGGYRPLREWIWSGTRGFIPKYVRPLTVLWLPLLSTAGDMLLVRPLFPSIQDKYDNANQAFREALEAIMKRHRDTHEVIYLAGHDHCLQLLSLGKNLAGPYQVVSGSAAKKSPVEMRKESLFASDAHGFARLDVTQEAIWITFFEVNVARSTLCKVATFRIPKRGEVEYAADLE